MHFKQLSLTAVAVALMVQQGAAQFSISLPDREVTVEYVNGTTTFKGAPAFGEPGQPMLPGYKVTFLLPKGVDPQSISIAINDQAEEMVPGTFSINPALPPSAKGEIVWPEGKNIRNGMDMDVYGKDAFFPTDFKGSVSFGKMREYQLVDIVITPFKYNPITRQLKKLTGGTLTVTIPNAAAVNSTLKANSTATKKNGSAEKFLRKNAVNPEVIDSYSAEPQSNVMTNAATLAGVAPNADPEGYAIITTQTIVNTSTQLQNLINQKTASGYNVILATESTWGGGTGDVAAERIRSWLRRNVSTLNISYVLLIGNPNPASGDVPMKMCWPRYTEPADRNAPTDFYYAELSGNWDTSSVDPGYYGTEADRATSGGPDIYAEVAVGRIPYYGTIADLDKILAKSVTYANASSRGWRKDVLLPMVPSDEFTPGFYLGEEINTNYLQPDSWKSFRIYNKYSSYTQRYLDAVPALSPTIERVTNSSANTEDVWKKNPFGLVIWWTHGSTTSASDVFMSSQAANLNDKYPSMTFQVSCDNSYPESSGNLAYSLLLNGAVSAISATRVSIYWIGENSNYLNSGSNAGMGYTYGLHLTNDQMPTGDALNAAKMNVAHGLLWMNHLVFNVYGCPDLGLNIDESAPSDLRVTGTSPSIIGLSWMDNSAIETGFRIERATGSGAFSEIATVGANITYYSSTGLAANTKYRYRVRMYSGTGGTSDYSNIDSTSTFANVAPGKTASASSIYSSTYSAAMAVDNNTTTRWRALNYDVPQWLTIDLGSSLMMSGTEVMWQNSGVIYRYRIETSNDNVQWSTAADLTNNTSTAQTQTQTFNAEARYVRLYVTALPANAAASCYEFRVIGQTVPSNFFINPPESVPEDQLQLSWQPSVGATSYTIYQSQLGYPRHIIAEGLTTRSFTTSGLIGGKGYLFNVVGINSAGHSINVPGAYELWATATITPPIALTGISIIPNYRAPGYSISWVCNATNGQGFEIERAVLGTSNWSVIGTSPYWDTYFYDATTDFLTSYQYRVRGFNDGGYSAYSGIVNTQIPPIDPQNFTATFDGASTISLNWSYGGSTQTGFRLERSTDGSNYQLIATTERGVFTYNNTGIASNYIYYYRLCAFNSYGNSNYIYTSVITPPAAPASLTATASGSTVVVLNWTDNSPCEETVTIEQAVGSGAFSAIGGVSANTTTFTSMGLTASTTYRYRVYAQNSAGTSGYSNIVTITTPAPTPTAPSNLTATANSSSQITLVWNDNSTNETGFYIERATSSSGPFNQIASVGANVANYANTGLTAGTTYWYRVRAYNANGNSSYSNTASATTQPGAPNAPTALGATVNSRTQITLTWTDNASNETGFYIERALSGGSFTQIASVGANVLTYVNTGLTAGTAYQYRVRAYNGSGNSAYSNTATATTHSNLALSGTASSQSQQTGNETTKAKDNSTTTRWAASSSTMPQWWKIDLGSSKTLSEVEIMFERTGTTGDCNDFKVETSTDNSTWIMRVDRLTNTNTAQTQAYTLSATARYVRITINDAPGTYWASMYEFRTFGQ